MLEQTDIDKIIVTINLQDMDLDLKTISGAMGMQVISLGSFFSPFLYTFIFLTL